MSISSPFANSVAFLAEAQRNSGFLQAFGLTDNDLFITGRFTKTKNGINIVIDETMPLAANDARREIVRPIVHQQTGIEIPLVSDVRFKMADGAIPPAYSILAGGFYLTHKESLCLMQRTGKIPMSGAWMNGAGMVGADGLPYTLFKEGGEKLAVLVVDEGKKILTILDYTYNGQRLPFAPDRNTNILASLQHHHSGLGDLATWKFEHRDVELEENAADARFTQTIRFQAGTITSEFPALFSYTDTNNTIDLQRSFVLPAKYGNANLIVVDPQEYCRPGALMSPHELKGKLMIQALEMYMRAKAMPAPNPHVMDARSFPEPSC